MKYGYMRVSTKDKQEFLRQEYILKDYNLDKVFEEKISGTKRACNREEFEKLLEVVAPGDEVYFESMSRMARSMQDLIDTTNLLAKKKKVKVIFVKENLRIGGDNGLDAMGGLVFHIMGAFAQFERDLISDRTKTALAAKKAQGVKLGAKQKYLDEDVAKVKDMASAGMTYQQISKNTGISIATISRIINKQ
ncbi:MAG: recombinase family protein [Clostridia bacterium]|nr:recombinase family protein [Clostridia bacterium]